MKNNKFLTMAIESSCDETSVAFLLDGREVLSNVISSQIPIHTKFGGVVPELASRHHLENISRVIDQAMEEACVSWDEIDLIGVTQGPGLIGALLVGVATAKAISWAKDIPLVGVHHIHGHICANFIQYPDLEPPFMGLVVSGGHTNIVNVTGYDKCEIIGATRDDAIGEAYDKIARVIGLGYPGGPKVDKAAQKGNGKAVKFKRIYLEKDSLDFSFSGLKTAVLNYINSEKQAGREIITEDVAASFQAAALDVIVDKIMFAVKKFKQDKLVVAGGVAANSELRARLGEETQKAGVKLYVPDPILCTDNAAMIGCAAYYAYKDGKQAGLDMEAYANLPLCF